jgi:hypothetical protein
MLNKLGLQLVLTSITIHLKDQVLYLHNVFWGVCDGGRV